MADNIYVFEGNQDWLLNEKFENHSVKKIQLYVWKTADGPLGFDTNNDAKSFVNCLLNGKLSINFDKNDINKVENEVRVFAPSITFLNNESLIEDDYKNYLNYKINKQKNASLSRYNKPIIDVEIPEIIKWYNDKERRYTHAFSNYTHNNNIDFLIWAFSDYGIYFFTFSDVRAQVISIADKLGIACIEVTDELKMPNY